MLAITKRDKIFSLFALPIAIIAVYAWMFGADVHKDCNAYSEHIEQLGSEEDLMAQQASLNSQLARAKKELAALKEQATVAQADGASEAKAACEVCGDEACRGKAFCFIPGARINAFRELLASNEIKIVSAVAINNSGQKVVKTSALEEELDFIPVANASATGNTPTAELLKQYPGCQRWGFSIESSFGALTAMLEKCEQEEYPFVIEAISMVSTPTSSNKKLWYIQIVL